MKISVCITVYNEEGSISALINSLLVQTKKPNEIVIVDGGSADKTVEIIKHYQKKDKRIKLVLEPGSVAHGRNVSVDVSRHEIVALTDAGCTASKTWLERITQPFKHRSVGLVAGFYKMGAKYPIQRVLNVFYGVPPERFDPLNFMPSARSIAFRKSVWENVGGFSEKLDRAGEDTLFIHEAIKQGVRIVRVRNAVVHWKESATLGFWDGVRKFYFYARGDAQSGVFWDPTKRLATHNIKVISVIARYMVGLVLFVIALNSQIAMLTLFSGIVIYLGWSVWKWRDVIKGWQSKLWLPVVQIASDIAVILGFIFGIRENLRARLDR